MIEKGCQNITKEVSKSICSQKSVEIERMPLYSLGIQLMTTVYGYS